MVDRRPSPLSMFSTTKNNHHIWHGWHIFLSRPCRRHIRRHYLLQSKTYLISNVVRSNASQPIPGSGLSGGISMRPGGCLYLVMSPKQTNKQIWIPKSCSQSSFFSHNTTFCSQTLNYVFALFVILSIVASSNTIHWWEETHPNPNPEGHSNISSVTSPTSGTTGNMAAGLHYARRGKQKPMNQGLSQSCYLWISMRLININWYFCFFYFRIYSHTRLKRTVSKLTSSCSVVHCM